MWKWKLFPRVTRRAVTVWGFCLAVGSTGLTTTKAHAFDWYESSRMPEVPPQVVPPPPGSEPLPNPEPNLPPRTPPRPSVPVDDEAPPGGPPTTDDTPPGGEPPDDDGPPTGGTPPTPNEVPEPSTLILGVLAAGGAWLAKRRRA